VFHLDRSDGEHRLLFELGRPPPEMPLAIAIRQQIPANRDQILGDQLLQRGLRRRKLAAFPARLPDGGPAGLIVLPGFRLRREAPVPSGRPVQLVAPGAVLHAAIVHPGIDAPFDSPGLGADHVDTSGE